MVQAFASCLPGSRIAVGLAGWFRIIIIHRFAARPE